MSDTKNTIWIPTVVLGSLAMAFAAWSFSKRRKAKRMQAAKTENDTTASYLEENNDSYISVVEPSRIKEITLPKHLKPEAVPSKRPLAVTSKKAHYRKPQSIDKITAVGNQIVQHRYRDAIKPRPDIVRYKEYYSYLQNEFEVLQLGIQNTTDKERTIVLWGANEEPPVTINTREDRIDKAVNRSFTKFDTKVGTHPQGIIVNPSNGLIYVANQLSDTVSVLSGDGAIIDTIKLVPNAINGHNSPVDFAVQTQTNTANYGKVYVVGSVSNTISVLDAANTIAASIPVGERPVACAFHPITADLFVCNLLDHTLSVIDTETETVIKTLDTGLHPRGITIDELTGNIYVINSGDNSISIFSQDLQLLTTLTNVSPNAHPELVSAVIHPENNILFVVATAANQLIPISLENNRIGSPISVGNSPYGIVLHAENNFLYLGNRDDNSISVLQANGTVLGVIPREQVNIGLAYDPSTHAVLTSDTAKNTVIGLGFYDKPAIIIDGDYKEKREEFKYLAAYIKHVKFILSGEERFQVLSLLHETVTGKTQQKPIAFSAYDNAQSFANVSEVFELENTVLDGKHRWKFKIAPFQKITILVYYYQIETHKLSMTTDTKKYL